MVKNMPRSEMKNATFEADLRRAIEHLQSAIKIFDDLDMDLAAIRVQEAIDCIDAIEIDSENIIDIRMGDSL